MNFYKGIMVAIIFSTCFWLVVINRVYSYGYEEGKAFQMLANMNQLESCKRFAGIGQ